jgi:hypothetical protein
MDQFLALRLLMEESGMIKWVSKNGKKNLEIEPNCISQLKSLYPDKKREIHLGEKAKDILVMSVKGMVIEVARYYLAKMRLDNSKLDELIQMGYLGATYSLYKFNPTKNIKWSSYAYLWIKAKISRGSYQDYLIKANLKYEALILTVPQRIKRFDLLAFSTDLLWIYLSQKTIYPTYPFKFYSESPQADDGYTSSIFDTLPCENNRNLVDEIHLILSQDEIDILMSDDQTTKKKKDNVGILEMALMQGIPLDNFYDKKQQIINKVMERIEL